MSIFLFISMSMFMIMYMHIHEDFHVYVHDAHLYVLVSVSVHDYSHIHGHGHGYWYGHEYRHGHGHMYTHTWHWHGNGHGYQAWTYTPGMNILEERWLNGSAPDCKSVVLGSNPVPPQHTTNSVSPEVGSHLGWHGTVCWPLRGGRGTPYTQKNLKIYRKKKMNIPMLKMQPEHNIDCK